MKQPPSRWNPDWHGAPTLVTPRTLVAGQDTFASMTADEVIGRIHLAADPIYGRAGSQAIVGRIDELDRSPSLSRLLSVLQAA
ncbi:MULTISPECIES: AAA family ATPase [Streptomyces]|uniref:AAA family ATPase n=1 Tax=Streptomyces lycopersici TaxID=2974589 RepID=UPI0021D0E4C3|nr:AAA family ATPase [Streptomyces sp. NEAU-383]